MGLPYRFHRYSVQRFCLWKTCKWQLWVSKPQCFLYVADLYEIKTS